MESSRKLSKIKIASNNDIVNMFSAYVDCIESEIEKIEGSCKQDEDSRVRTSPSNDPSSFALCSSPSEQYQSECTSPPSGHSNALASDIFIGGPFCNKRRCSALQVVLASDVVYMLHCVFSSCSTQPAIVR